MAHKQALLKAQRAQLGQAAAASAAQHNDNFKEKSGESKDKEKHGESKVKEKPGQSQIALVFAGRNQST